MKQNLSFCFLVVIFQHQHIFLAAYKKKKGNNDYIEISVSLSHLCTV